MRKTTTLAALAAMTLVPRRLPGDSSRHDGDDEPCARQPDDERNVVIARAQPVRHALPDAIPPPVVVSGKSPGQLPKVTPPGTQVALGEPVIVNVATTSSHDPTAGGVYAKSPIIWRS